MPGKTLYTPVMDTVRPYSAEYAEHYWSGGAPEKTHVFLHGNRLPQRFAATGRFTVAELGFGTALTFLLAARLWQQTAPASAALTYIGYELHPLPLSALHAIHAAFPASLQPLSAAFLALYNPVPGWQTVTLAPSITLHLYVGDAATGITTHPVPADCWFLDGFSPAKNPALWTPMLLAQVAVHTVPGGSASTYSVARTVRESLTAAGFLIEKAGGHPPKADMLTARKP